MTPIAPIAELQRDPVRDRLHDLRNLFGVVASGAHLLHDPIAPERRDLVLDAMDRAAMRGSEILSAMLAGPGAEVLAPCQLSDRLIKLEPMLSTMAGEKVALRFDLTERSTLVRCVPEQFDRVVVELVANASRALPAGGAITLRLRRTADRVWLIVADTGVGMSSSAVASALGRLPPLRPMEHGTGMGQVRAFARDAGGTLHLRSRRGRGTVVALAMPPIQTDAAPYGESTILASASPQ